MNAVDKLKLAKIAENEGEQTNPKKKKRKELLLPHDDKYYVGAPQESCSLSQLEILFQKDLAFKDFRKRLIVFLNKNLPIYNVALPGGKYLRLNADHSVNTEFSLFHDFSYQYFVLDCRIPISQDKLRITCDMDSRHRFSTM